MAPTSALAHSTTKGNDARAIFDDIDTQFQLDDEGLFAITQQFLNDFKLGLGEYNHSMAMMCA